MCNVSVCPLEHQNTRTPGPVQMFVSTLSAHLLAMPASGDRVEPGMRRQVPSMTPILEGSAALDD